MSFDLDAHTASRAAAVEAALDRFLPPAEAEPGRLHAAMRYSVTAGGKRLRPMLVLDCCAAVGGRADEAMPTACAFECIHTYSLIHDDLPCMDDDDLRRGRPSCHKQFDEETALLAGDALQTLAFALCAANAGHGAVTAERALRATAVLAEAAGAPGMVGGQMLDLLAERHEPTAELVRSIHLRKTTALIRAACRAGGILGGGDEPRVAALAEYGGSLGLAFQIVDDILDIEGDEAALGKPIGSDQARGKATWPALFGLEASRAEAEELIAAATGALDGFGDEAAPLRALARFVIERNN